MAGRVDYKVKKEDEGQTLGRLARHKMAVSASLLRRLKREERGILLDGEEVFVNVLPKEGQIISLLADDGGTSENIIPQQGDFGIAYEDELMLIADKPGGLPVHPSRGHADGTLANYIAGLFQSRQEDLVFHAINRLDRGTSGLMCIAKTRYSAALLSKALSEGKITRSYLALCEGTVEPKEGTINLPIGRAEGFGIKREVRADGAPAVTHYKTVKNASGRSLLSVRLETGRTHQIRVHFSHLGHPLTGDFMYGEEIEGFDRVALHSASIEIELPDRKIAVESPLPSEFFQFIDL